jgi:hypothetical protein
MHPMKIRAGGLVLSLAILGAALLAACGGGGPPAGEDQGATGTSGGGVASGSGYDFPTGPAVMVPEGYEPPDSHVPNTGTYLPVNGKPTLVFVDAIW